MWIILGGQRHPQRTVEPVKPSARTAVGCTQCLIDSIGVVVHFNYTDTSYGRQAEIIALLRQLGVHHLRDAVAAPGTALAAGLQAAAAVGIRADLGAADVNIPPAQSVAESLQVLPHGIDSFEGPNEIDNSGIPAWPQVAASYARGLAAAVRALAPEVTVIQPSYLYAGGRAQVPPVPGLLNDHPYPLGGPPEPVVEQAVAAAGSGAGARGLVFTETGYHNALYSSVGQPPVSDAAAAVYLPRLLLTAYQAGVRRTFIYELADEKPDPGLTDAEEHFGLVRQDLAPKPAFTAIQTLIRALQITPGAGRVDWPRLSAAQPGSVWALRLARPDGSQVLALWRNVSVWDQARRVPIGQSPEPIRLTFPHWARDLAVWRPSISTGPVAEVAEARTLALSLAGDAVLVSFR